MLEYILIFNKIDQLQILYYWCQKWISLEHHKLYMTAYNLDINSSRNADVNFGCYIMERIFTNPGLFFEYFIFPMSVSVHQNSTHIYSSTTDTM